MRSRTAFAIAAAALAVSATPALAQTATIDLSTLPLGTFTSEVFGDYQIENAWGYGSGSEVFVGTNGNNVLGDDIADGDGAGFVISRVDGAAFNLNFVTFGQSLGNLGVVTLATYSGKDYPVTVTADGQTATPGITNLASYFIDANSFGSAGGVGISGVQVERYFAAAVPEPATWAMMIFGFGVVGGAMRVAKQRSDRKFNAKIKSIMQGVSA